MLLVAAFAMSLSVAQEPPSPQWLSWSADVFARARREKKLVLLDLGANWCHWCHVMEKTTYRDPAVLAVLQRAYLAVAVDQDERPDLAARYQDWGWPATIVFDGEGTELAKLRGYIEPARMASLLEAFEKDPTPGPSAVPALQVAPVDGKALDPGLRGELLQRLYDRYDAEHASWGTVHKYLDADRVELCLRLAQAGDARAAAMARATLAAERALIDPVWGGAYQYSHGGVWTNPHFEKIMTRQAADLRAYSLAHALWDDREDLESARAVHRWLRDFLRTGSGAFQTSQNADVVDGEHAAEYFALGDRERRARGLPTIDRNLYARDNGLAIEGLAWLYAAGGDAQVLRDAIAAAEWVLAHRALEGGGFAHGDSDPGSAPFLADTLAMGSACLALHAVTAEARWLETARGAAVFVEAKFRDPQAGYRAASRGDGPLPAVREPTENIALARFSNLLFHYTGDRTHRAIAEHAFAFAAAPERARTFFLPADLLLLDLELREDPLHVTVVGGKDDPRAAALFAAAIAAPTSYRRIEWWDPHGPALPYSDVELPPAETPAAFLCANGACSAPIEDPEALRAELRRTR
jgi:hypothetical protein